MLPEALEKRSAAYGKWARRAVASSAPTREGAGRRRSLLDAHASAIALVPVGQRDISFLPATPSLNSSIPRPSDRPISGSRFAPKTSSTYDEQHDFRIPTNPGSATALGLRDRRWRR